MARQRPVRQHPGIGERQDQHGDDQRRDLVLCPRRVNNQIAMYAAARKIMSSGIQLNSGRTSARSRAQKSATQKKREQRDRQKHAHEDQQHLLRINISALHRKLEPDPSRPVYIVTEPAVGYRFRDVD